MDSAPNPWDVFTPGKPPLGAESVYVHRTGPEERLTESMQRHLVPVVFGEFGVGKTSVVRRFLLGVQGEGRLVYIPSAKELTLQDVFTRCLEHLNFSVQVSQTSSTGTQASAGIDIRVVRLGAEVNENDTATFEMVVTSPTDGRVVKLLQDARIYLVIDELHEASDAFREELATFIKATRTDADDFQLILIGTSSDAKRLVDWNAGIDRYLKETPVPVLDDTEALAIIDKGFERLGITLSEDVRQRIRASSVGAPTIVQELCLNVAERVFADARDVANQDDVDVAIDKYLESHETRMLGKYMAAIETTGPRRYRKQILHTIARLDTDYATMEDLVAGVSASIGEDVPPTALSGPLRSLKDADYGSILSDVSRVESGDRIANLTTFTDPMMKSFVRFMAQKEDAATHG